MAADIAVGSGRMAQTAFEMVAYGRAWRWRHGWARRGSGTTGSDRAHEQASVKAMPWGTVAMGEGMAPVKIWAAKRHVRGRQKRPPLKILRGCQRRLYREVFTTQVVDKINR